MPRTQQMKEYLSDFEKQLKEERLKRIKMIYEDDWKKAAEILKTALGAFMLKEDTGVFVLSYLRTSCITGSHEFLLSYYEEEPFIEEQPQEITVNMSPLFAGVEEDFEILNQYLSGNFIRIFPYEKEEIRRWYLLELYQNMGDIVTEIIERIPTGQERILYFGGYMEGDLKEAGKI